MAKLHCKGCEAWDRIEAQYAELSRKYDEQRDDYDKLRAALERIVATESVDNDGNPMPETGACFIAKEALMP